MNTESREWPAVAYETLPWHRSGDDIGSRRSIKASIGPYDAAIPPKIATLDVTVPSGILAEADDATNEIARFDAAVGSLTAPFSSILLRTESASSSQVENITSSAKQLALAEIRRSTSGNARLVVANVRAMKAAIELADRLDAESVIDMHRALLEESDPGITGHWRDVQVWIGGGGLSPHAAAFVPPAPARVPELMDDLMEFTQRADIPLLAQIAIAHAQFETVHPFPDGNGRTGRALVQGMLRGGRLTRSVIVPVSAGLLHDLPRYIEALTAYRRGAIEPIIEAFVEASFAAIRNGWVLVDALQATRDRWDSVLVARSDSSVHALKTMLLRQPVVSATTVAEGLGVSEVTAQTGIDRLVDSGILRQAGGGQRYRLYEAREVLEALDAFAARARRSGRGA
ncbi:Fic family protein [Herbiconiux moechotypicola]|uniref:Fic family protein n=1 Tax=Herbiconiux moechotypicola TaxID=637393 RepID=A0ABN3DH02_9MICO|nr:Fic family protein [Herbiconiux moechotypicola]MCS5729583.1 Fic family protein [Herbiconiux moechotypicola]